MSSAVELGVLCAAADGVRLRQTAQRAESLGFARLAVTDHLDLSGAHVSRLSWVPALAFAAAATTTLRLTPMVANQDLRNAAVMACDLSSLDRLSDGRIELGIGAGWNTAEYQWAGLPYAPAGERIERLGEVIEAVRGLLDGQPGPFSLDGRYVRIDAMPRVPSMQQPIPLRMGGAQPRMLALAAARADIVNLNTLRETEPTDIVLDRMTHQLGTFAGPIELSVVMVAIGDDPVEAIRAELPGNRFAQHVVAAHGADGIDALVRMPHVLAGSVTAIAEELLRRRERWSVSSTIVPDGAMDALAPVLELLR